MRRYFELVRSYQLDHFCTPVSWGRVRRFFCHWLPSFWWAASELISERLNASLLDPSNPAPRNLKVWERVLLALGF